MARSFDSAASQYLSNGNAVLSGAPLALVCRFRLRDATNLHSLLAISAASGVYPRFGLIARGDTAGDPLQFQVCTGTCAEVNSTSGYSAETWHHAVGISVTNVDHRVFLDGGSKGTSSTDKTPAGLDTTSIGILLVNATSYFPADGDVAEAAVYDLSAWPGATASDKADEFERVAVPALAAGVSPRAIPLGRVTYWPLLRTDQDLVGGYGMTPYNSPTWADHPPDVRYPVPRLWPGYVAAGGANYDVSFTLARTAAVSPSASAAALASAALGRTAAIGQAGVAATVAAAMLSRELGLSSGGQAATLAAAALNRDAGIGQSASAAALASATLTRELGVSQGARTNALASTTLAREAGLTDGAAAAASASLQLDILKAVTQAAVAAALGDVALANERGISQSATAATAASFTTTIYEAIGFALGVTATLTLSRSLASTFAASAASQATLALEELLGVSFGASAATLAAVDLEKVLRITASALAAASATIAVARSLGVSFVGTEGEIAAAAIALTLHSRDLSLTLQERSLALTLIARALDLTLQDRD